MYISADLNGRLNFYMILFNQKKSINDSKKCFSYFIKLFNIGQKFLY